MRIRTTVATAATTLLLLTACSGGGEEPAEVTPTAPVATDDEQTEDAAPEPPEDEPDADTPHAAIADPGPPPLAWDGVAEEATWGIETDYPAPVMAGGKALAPLRLDERTLRLVGYDPADGSIVTDITLEAPEGATAEGISLEPMGPEHVLVGWGAYHLSVHSVADGTRVAEVEASDTTVFEHDVPGDIVRAVQGTETVQVITPAGVFDTGTTDPVAVHDGRPVPVSRETVESVSATGTAQLAQASEASAFLLGADTDNGTILAVVAALDPTTGTVTDKTTCPAANVPSLPVVSAGGTWLQHSSARVDLTSGEVECLDPDADMPVMVGDDGSSWVYGPDGTSYVAPGQTTPEPATTGVVPFAVTEGNVLFAPVDDSTSSGLVSYPRQG